MILAQLEQAQVKRLAAIACCSWRLPALADSDLPPARWADRQLPDPRQEAQAKALMEELRCLVCQGQSIADSDAELAGDMRAHGAAADRRRARRRQQSAPGWSSAMAIGSATGRRWSR